MAKNACRDISVLANTRLSCCATVTVSSGGKGKVPWLGPDGMLDVWERDVGGDPISQQGGINLPLCLSQPRAQNWYLLTPKHSSPCSVSRKRGDLGEISLPVVAVGFLGDGSLQKGRSSLGCEHDLPVAVTAAKISKEGIWI